MVTKSCSICDKEFNVRGNSKCCSSECSKLLLKTLRRKGTSKYLKQEHIVESKKKLKKCSACGNIFRAIGNNKNCSDECKKESEKLTVSKYYKSEEYKDRPKTRKPISEKVKEYQKEYQRSYKISEETKLKKKERVTTPENKEKLRIKAKDYSLRNPKKTWAISTLKGHKGRGNEILITVKELEKIAISVETCPFCGCNLKWERGTGQSLSSPSLDRVDNENTITPYNIMIICKRCNSTKYDRTLSEFIDYCRNITEKFKEI